LLLFLHASGVHPALHSFPTRRSSDLAGLPGVKTVAESGYPGFDVAAWHGLLVPAGTPPAIIQRINEAVNKVLLMPEVQARLEQGDRKSTRLNSSHVASSYAVFCLKKK